MRLYTFVLTQLATMKRLNILLLLSFENENYDLGQDAQLSPTAHILDEQRFPWLWFIFIGSGIISTEIGAIQNLLSRPLG